MGIMDVPSDVISYLEKATGKDGSKRKSAYDIVQPNPKARINSWIKTSNHTVIHSGDASPECQEFYKNYTQYYKPLEDMLKENGT